RAARRVAERCERCQRLPGIVGHAVILKTMAVVEQEQGRESSLTALDRRDVYLVAGGIGESPPRRREVTHDAPAGGKGGREPSLGLLGGEPDRDVDRPATVRARFLHLLEPERNVSVVRVHEVLVGVVE